MTTVVLVKMAKEKARKTKEREDEDAFIFHRHHRLILRRKLLHKIVLGDDIDDPDDPRYFISDRVLLHRLDDALKLTQVR